MVRALLFLVIFALAIYAVSDVIASTDQQRNRTPKFVWILITLFIPVLGPIVWIVFSSGNKRAGLGSPAPSAPSPNRPSRFQQSAPDDDPDFLWKLAAEQRRKRAEEERKAKEQDGKEAGGSSAGEAPDDPNTDS